ncbi:exonuclease/endonuclease/phosphatase family protein [Bacteroides finegoldii]|uniref:hypothetical protein n=1 Tax=Bacteroides finegoldii TaxID=338188 RepID=UPI0018A0417A|nr:hypothetical protein [Bacteroides finegoldii]
MKLNKLPLNVIGLNRVGLNQIGSPSRRANTSARPYIDPEVLASLVAVCICDGKSNDDPDRAVIKNLVDPDNPFIISNAAYKLNSGYGKYEEDFTTWRISKPGIVSTINVNSIHITRIESSLTETHAFFENVTTTKKFNIKLKISGLTSDMKCTLNNENTVIKEFVNGVNEISVDLVAGWYGFMITSLDGSVIGDCDITIEQIPSHQGAFVTDGKDDLITSTKTVKEMLGGSNEVTVVSMVHQIGLSSLTTINNIRSESVAHVVCRNICSSAGKTGIYGYSRQINTNNPPTLINNILGDKKDYTTEGNSALDPTDKFFVQGYKYSGTISEVSQIAYYWTFISNKTLTTDQINQVISYFNLDKHVKPDIIYDTIRQGITNENHASFNDELVDFSGNGHNMKIYNSAWNKESGINDEGAWQTDSVSDYGKVENLPIYKDYTVVADREIVDGLIDNANGGVATRSYNYAKGAFGFDWKKQAFSFGGNTDRIIDVQRFISYQSKYVNNGIQLITGNVVDNNPLYMARLGEENRYSKLALWSFLLFPYSLSEFLLERQLKRYKLGTLYPDMVEFRPVISRNIPYNDIWITQGSTTLYNKSINKTGIYLQEGSTVIVYIQPSGIDEVSKITINGVEYTDLPINPNGFYYADFPITKSPQKISYAIDEYIRYEDIVQPYPAIINLKQDGKTITWGDKLKVGSDIVFAGSANLLPELYTVSDTRYNGVTLYPNTIIKVEKSMVFDNARIYLKANEPNCILSPNRLRIPNSSYKILRYIPDLTGKGNHGIINNSTYAGMSGANGYIEPFNDNKWHISSSANKINRTDNKITVVSLKANRGIIYVGTGTYVNEIKVIATGIPVGGELIFHQDTDITIPNNVIVTIGGKISTGSWEFIVNDLTLDWSNLVIEQLGQYEGSFCLDGVDDYITIPTLAHGGKQVLMKVNLQSYDRYLYDQRNSWSQYLAIVSAGKTIAYEYSNKGGKTYIDGILNEHIIDKDLLNITHNITATNANIGVQYAPNIGTSFARGNFAQMALFDFMLFPDISSEEEIKELNEVMGIENNIEVS